MAKVNAKSIEMTMYKLDLLDGFIILKFIEKLHKNSAHPMLRKHFMMAV